MEPMHLQGTMNGFPAAISSSSSRQILHNLPESSAYSRLVAVSKKPPGPPRPCWSAPAAYLSIARLIGPAMVP